MQEDKTLRPSQAFVYLTLDEIPPGAYPEFAVEEVRQECRRAYRRQRGWHSVTGRILREALAGLTHLVLLNERFARASRASVESGKALDLVPPRHVAVLRALG